MKKFFIATILAVAAVLPASAQVRSLDMKANLRSDFGLGIGVTFQLPRNFSLPRRSTIISTTTTR